MTSPRPQRRALQQITTNQQVTPKSSRVGSSKTAVTHLTPVAEGPKSAKKRTKITVFDENSQVVQKPSFAKQLAERDAEAKRAVKISAAGQRAAATVSETILSSIPRDILFGEELEQKRAAWLHKVDEEIAIKLQSVEMAKRDVDEYVAKEEASIAEEKRVHAEDRARWQKEHEAMLGQRAALAQTKAAVSEKTIKLNADKLEFAKRIDKYNADSKELKLLKAKQALEHQARCAELAAKQKELDQQAAQLQARASSQLAQQLEQDAQAAECARLRAEAQQAAQQAAQQVASLQRELQLKAEQLAAAEAAAAQQELRAEQARALAGDKLRADQAQVERNTELRQQLAQSQTREHDLRKENARLVAEALELKAQLAAHPAAASKSPARSPGGLTAQSERQLAEGFELLRTRERELEEVQMQHEDRARRCELLQSAQAAGLRAREHELNEREQKLAIANSQLLQREVQVQLVEKAAREEVDSLTLRDEALRRDQAKIASTLAEQQRRQEEFSRLQQAFLNAQSLFEGEKVKLVEELDERATRLAAKEEELQAMDHEAHTEREANRQLHADLERADRELVRQAQELAEKEREQAEREARLAETSAMLEEKQETLTRVESELLPRLESLGAREQQLAEREEAVRATAQVHQQKEAYLRLSVNENGEQAKRLMRMKRELEAEKERLDARELVIETKAAELQAFQRPYESLPGMGSPPRSDVPIVAIVTPGPGDEGLDTSAAASAHAPRSGRKGHVCSRRPLSGRKSLGAGAAVGAVAPGVLQLQSPH